MRLTRYRTKLIPDTDHLPLVSALRNHSDRYTEQEIRQLDFLSQFVLEFRNVKGAENEVADTFFRISINSFRFAQSIDNEALAQAQIDASLFSGQLPPSRSVFPFLTRPLLCPVTHQQVSPAPSFLRRFVARYLRRSMT